MKHGEEVAYVRSRTGFVRIAMQHGTCSASAITVNSVGEVIGECILGKCRDWLWGAGSPLIHRSASGIVYMRIQNMGLGYWAS
jgi:hypothetical protein